MLIRNTIANFAGQLLYPLLALALVPFYLRFLGIEGYGLIGLVAMVVSVLGVFSKGLGSALQREFGRRSATPEGQRSLRSLLRSFEVVYWFAGAGLALALGALAVTLGSRWIRADGIPPQTIVVCLVLLAFRVALAFPHSVYQSVFIGTERQVRGNVLNALLALSSAAAGVLSILWFDSVVAYYCAEVLTAGVFLIVFRSQAFASLPAAAVAFESGEIRALFRASTELMWTNGIGLLISNLDRLVISAVFPVAVLGLYTAAVSAARAVGLALNPFLMAAYPRICRIAGTGSREQQVEDLLRTASVVAALGAAITLPLSAFSVDVLLFWLRDPELAGAGGSVLSLYALGGLAIGLATVLYQWQMATGTTQFGARFNTAALVWFPAVLWILVQQYGLAGAALSWLLYAAAAWAYHIGVTFRPAALGRDAGISYARVVMAATLPVAAVALAGRLAVDNLATGRQGRIAALVAVSLVSGLWATRPFLSSRRRSSALSPATDHRASFDPHARALARGRRVPNCELRTADRE